MLVYKHARLRRYKTAFHAQRELNDVVMREFARTGLRVGARTGLFVGVFSALTLVAEKLRGRKDVVNVVAAGATAGGVLGIPKGPAGAARGVLIGGGFSFAYGLLLHALWEIEARVVVPDKAAATDAQNVSVATDIDGAGGVVTNAATGGDYARFAVDNETASTTDQQGNRATDRWLLRREVVGVRWTPATPSQSSGDSDNG